MNVKNPPAMLALCLGMRPRLIHNHDWKKAEAYESRPIESLEGLLGDCSDRELTRGLMLAAE